MRVVLAAPGRPYDLLLICSLTGAAVLLSILEVTSALTSALAFVCIFFTPGYALVSAMFPGRSSSLGKLLKGDEERESEMSLLERVIASVVMSLLVFAIGGVLLAWTPGGLDKTTALAELLVINIAFSALAMYRRFKLTKGDEFALAFELGGSGGGKLKAADKVVLGVVVATLAVAALAGAGLLWPGIGLEPHTEFYITGPDGSLGSLPQTLRAGADGTVLITFVNHMGAPTDYNLTFGVLVQGAYLNQSAMDWGESLALSPGDSYYYQTTLADGARSANHLSFSFASRGSYEITFQLDDGVDVLDLWLYVAVT